MSRGPFINAWQNDPDWDRHLFPSPHEQREDERKEEQQMVDADLERLDKKQERKGTDA
jgi:hypothetical protein